MTWPALHAASARNEHVRVPFLVQERRVGSVARQHLPLLARHAASWVEQREGMVFCARPDDAAFADLHATLRGQGAIRAWRDELFALFDPATLEPLARIERAATRFWGTLTLGAHATGYVCNAAPGSDDRRPSHLWIARRSAHKATDPGRLDNLVGGGVAAGQTPREALVREAFEEAGLAPAQLGAIGEGRVLRLYRDIPEGFQQEWLHSYDIELAPGLEPHNQDGEVAEFVLMPVPEVLRLVEQTEEMTTDAALVTIDFLLRHALLDDLSVARRVAARTVQLPHP